ncbi:Outer membrane protein assembly factor BamA [Thalassocella blandensis]|nr:Outer membrane protein assembly factor BamA [Thalassocella blandensis]
MFTLKTLGVVSFSSALCIAGLSSLPQHALSEERASTCSSTPENSVEIKQKRGNKADYAFAKKATIQHITIENKGIFDLNNPRENNALYRLANRLQTQTREWVIRNQLLFKEGDRFNLKKAKESMRILRDREYILEINMFIENACDGQIDIHIVVQDAWVIEPKLSYGRQGGEESSGFGLRNGNFLGTGNDIAIAYEKEYDRTRMSYRFHTDQFLRKQLELDLYHAQLSDGNEQNVGLHKPFYSLNTLWSYGASTSKTITTYTTRFNDEKINEFKQLQNYDIAYIGRRISLNDERAYRLTFGVSSEKDNFKTTEHTTQLPEYSQAQYTWITLERTTNIYEQYSNLNYIARKQDIEIGTNYSLSFGVGQDEDQNDLQRLKARFNRVVSNSDSHLFRMGIGTDLTHVTGEEAWQKSTVGIDGQYYYFINGENRWFLNLQYDEGKNLPEYLQFTLGETDGMRGYPIAYQRGDKRYIANFERRFYSKAHWFNLIRFGAVAFVDVGHAWGSEDYQDQSHLASAGFGLRFHSSKTGTPLVMHLNFSAPLVDNENLDNFLISFSMENRF